MGLWDAAKSVGGLLNPLEFSPIDVFANAGKLAYHATFDPTDTLEHRAERRMHMNDDMVGMIPLYGGLIEKAEHLDDVGAYWQRWVNGKTPEEAPTSEERKLAQAIKTQPQNDEENDAAAAGMSVERYREREAQRVADATEQNRQYAEAWNREHEAGKAATNVNVTPGLIPYSDPGGSCE